MSANSQGVVLAGDVIVSPKKPAEQVKFRWDPDLIQQVRDIAERTHRTMNEAAELLMRWAVQRASTELETAGEDSAAIRKRKPENP